MNDFSKICYSHETGVFTWAVSGKGIAIGRVAGCKNADGYWQIKINRQIYAAHTQIWANGVRHCLGSFRSAIEAHQAYLRAKSVLHISNGS